MKNKNVFVLFIFIMVSCGKESTLNDRKATHSVIKTENATIKPSDSDGLSNSTPSKPNTNDSDSTRNQNPSNEDSLSEGGGEGERLEDTVPVEEDFKPTGECPSSKTSDSLIGLLYPEVSSFDIKGIAYAPGDPNKRISLIKNAGTKVVSYNIPWIVVEPNKKKAPCGGGEFQYDGYCYRDVIGSQIKSLNQAGIRVTAILYGVPDWAHRQNSQCSPLNDSFKMFCSPDNPSDFARFAGMLAQVYDGKGGKGRIHNFVIHNEVNSNIWFDIGCGSGVKCDVDAWISQYADNYNKAYDKIKSHQSEAKVLISLEQNFGAKAENLSAEYPLVSGENFLTRFAKYTGDRQWQVAFHPYPPNLLKTKFSVLDWPNVTYGNPGQLVGWLRQNFPNNPHVWQVQFTESGINSSSPNSSVESQSKGVCASTYNVLATPWVTDYIYHGMFDDGLMSELQVGLFYSDGSAKPAWNVWANLNDCGYQYLPYTKLVRSQKDGKHWSSSRLPPADYKEENFWFLLRDGDCDSQQILWECNVNNRTTYLSKKEACPDAVNMGPVGFSYTKKADGLIGLFQCKNSRGQDWFVSTDSICEGQKVIEFLGYVKSNF